MSASGRLRGIVLAATASGGARAIAMITGFIAVPLTLNHLGAERYGLWMVISSLTLALNFADLGLGNSLVTSLAAAHGRGDRASARHQVSTAFFLFLAIALALLVAFAAVYRFVDWPGLFNVHSPGAIAEVGPALWAFVVCVLVGLVLGVVPRIELAHQNAAANGVWQAAGSVASLGALLVALRNDAGLPALVLTMSGVPALVAAAQAASVFFVTRPWLRPSLAWVRRDSTVELLRLGAAYVVLQVAATVSLYSDNLITTQILGPATVAQYSIMSRPFAIVTAAVAMALVPMWPAYTEALANRDFAWVHRALNRSLALMAVVAGIPVLLLTVAGEPLIRLWVRDPAFDVPTALLIALGVWTIIQAIGAVWATLLNGLALVRFQAMVAVVTAIVALAAKIVCARAGGVTGLVWGTNAAVAFFTLLPMGLYLRHALAKRAAGSEYHFQR